LYDAEQESRKSSAPIDQVGDEVELREANIHSKPVSCGWLIINADDWGRADRTTNRIVEYLQRRVLSFTTGMVFMGDSERAANIAPERRLEIGTTTWEVLRPAYQMSIEPFVSGGSSVGCGPRPMLPLAECH